MGWFGVGGVRGAGVMFLGLAGAAAWAQEVEPGSAGEIAMAASAGAAAVSLAAAKPMDDAPWRRPHPGFMAGTWGTSLQPVQAPRLSVVEIEPERLPGVAPRRAQHAVRMRAEWPRAALRSMGLATAECTTLFRMPSSLGRGGSFSVELRAQVRLACNY